MFGDLFCLHICFVFGQNDLDSRDFFKVPVLEQYPDIADAYLNVVDDPIDLRTIDEEFVCKYGAIEDLQKDLVRMFENSCRFNEAGSDVWEYAK